jgi:hypothetical protein
MDVANSGVALISEMKAAERPNSACLDVATIETKLVNQDLNIAYSLYMQCIIDDRLTNVIVTAASGPHKPPFKLQSSVPQPKTSSLYVYQSFASFQNLTAVG